MKSLLLLITLAAFCVQSHAAPPSVESVEELLRLGGAESTLDAMYANLEQSMRAGMKQASADKQLSAEQEKVLEIAPKKFIAVMREEFGWPVMKSTYIQIYRDSLEQEEVDGLIAFYQSPAGAAFIKKMPVIVQRAMEASQAQLTTFLPKMQKAMEEALREAGVKQ
jgi:uncharacterized protein